MYILQYNSRYSMSVANGATLHRAGHGTGHWGTERSRDFPISTAKSLNLQGLQPELCFSDPLDKLY